MATFISVITGHFKGFIWFSLIIMVHEFGHILMGIICAWRIEKVIVLPFGCLTIFHEDLNRSLNEEFLIVIMGPLFQIGFTFLLYCLGFNFDIIYYSLVILIFNLLPIFPLDGSKILNLFFNKVFSYKFSHFFSIIVSIIFIICLVFKSYFNLIFLFIIFFLFMRVISEIKNHDSLFNRFLLERFLKKYHFKKVKKINSLDMRFMMRDFRHVFFDGYGYISEGNLLKKRFDFKGKV